MRACRLSYAEAAPFPCLSAANPHIASSLETAAKRGGAVVHMPRLAAGEAAAAVAVAGISAFAFQGTNAHVLLSRQVWGVSDDQAVHQQILVVEDDPGLKLLRTGTRMTETSVGGASLMTHRLCARLPRPGTRGGTGLCRCSISCSRPRWLGCGLQQMQSLASIAAWPLQHSLGFGSTGCPGEPSCQARPCSSPLLQPSGC